MKPNVWRILFSLALALGAFAIVQKEMNPSRQESQTCYDLIIATMSQPQYWDQSAMPEYSIQTVQRAAEEQLVNGTGWVLVDEKTATFERGFQGRLSLNFVDRTAVNRIDQEFNVDGFDHQLYDFENNKVYRVFRTNDHVFYEDVTAIFERKQNNSYGADRFNIQDEIRKTFQHYESIFFQTGCPLYGQPSRTLTTYKNRIAKLVDKEPIPFVKSWAIWDQKIERRTTLFEDPSIVVINDYRNLFQIRRNQFSDEGARVFSEKMQTASPKYLYDPFFVVFTDRLADRFFQSKDPYSSAYFEQTYAYRNKFADFFLYFVNEQCRQIYDGEGCVYAVDLKENQDLLKSGRLPFTSNMSEEAYKQAGVEGKTVALTLYYHPSRIEAGMVVFADVNDDRLYAIAAYLDDVLEHYDVKSAFDSDYLKYFGLYYNLYWQRQLGLR